MSEYKCVSPQQAVADIRSGQRVFVGSNCAEPQTLVEALTSRADSLTDTEIVHILTLGIAPYSEARFENKFRHNAFFIGANVRDAINHARADYTPIFLSEVPALFRNGRIPLDVALIQVSPPDKHGWCSLGVSVDVIRAAVDSSPFVIAEVNQQMPRVLGDSFLHVSQIDVFVQSDRPLLELKPPVQTEVTMRIGQYIAEMIEDGATLQLGIGAIPDAVLSSLHGKKDLGIHTEMFSDGVVDLVESGAITNRRKTLHPGKLVATFCMGTRKLYDFIDNNPAVEMRPTEYVNDPFVIAKNDKMVAINAAIEVDLTGQVCADSIGERFYSGIGGQVDFVRGAARSRGGKPIIALPSTAIMSDGTIISRIVSDLKTGAGVVTSRGDVHYVVTEWGVAYLHGKSIRERAIALIGIAHPDFRAELLDAAKGRFLVSPTISSDALTARYPDEYIENKALKDGEGVVLRPIRPTDDELLREFHYQLSEDTLYHRYRRPLRSLPQSERAKLVNIDYNTQMAIIAVHTNGFREEMLGVGRFYVDESRRSAEVAFVVRDDHQGRGLGSILLKKLVAIARKMELVSLEAFCAPDNVKMIELLLRNHFSVQEGDLSSERVLRLQLRKRPESVKQSESGQR